MFNITFYGIIILVQEFIYLIILGSWILLFKYEILKSPNPLFAYIITLINNILFICYMIINGTPFIIFICYLIYFIFKIFSLLDLIVDYKATIDIVSIFTTILLILTVSLISSIFTINMIN